MADRGRDTAVAARSDDAFGADLLTALPAPEPAAGASGTVISPASIAAALRMLLLGAGGQTARQIASVLHLAGPGDAGPGLALLSDGLASIAGEDLTFRAPNTVWVQSGLPLAQEYVRALDRLARAGLRDADFHGAPQRATRDINALIEEQTAGKIADLLGPGDLSSDTRLVLVNAVYLKAAWQTPFQPAATRDRPFHTGAGDERAVPTMRMTTRLPYVGGDGYQTVLLPYVGGRLAMAVVLPDGPLPPCERKLAAHGMAGLVAGTEHRTVTLSLPRFRQRTSLDLIPVLRGLGMTDAFTTGADLSGITTAVRLFVDVVAHQAYVDVDERGTEAAAATAVGARMLSMIRSTPVTVTVDRPFLYAIIDTQTGLPLFLGRVVRPG